MHKKHLVVTIFTLFCLYTGHKVLKSGYVENNYKKVELNSTPVHQARKPIHVLGWGEQIEHPMSANQDRDGWFNLKLGKSQSFEECYEKGYLDPGMYMCNYTADFGMYDRSDAVLIRAARLHRFHLPDHRVPGQKWVFVEHESPGRLDYMYPDLDLRKYNGMMNLTATITMDSDIPRPDFIKKCSVNETKLKMFKDVDYTWKKRKDAFIGWILSDCKKKAQSNRMDYVNELKKYMKVHTYGWCGVKCGVFIYVIVFS